MANSAPTVADVPPVTTVAPAPAVTSAASRPQVSSSQRNALRSAEQDLDYSGFFRSGLIGQLVFEGFAYEQAEYGADAAY